ncbi:hypothetical protein [Antarcticimicrobium luteum]|nr:hypothetical protein [Antarcticimicrobium luteum]
MTKAQVATAEVMEICEKLDDLSANPVNGGDMVRLLGLSRKHWIGRPAR